MAKYRIPPPVVPGFEIIISLKSENIESLVSILENAKIGEGIKVLSEKINLNTLLGEEDSVEIMRSLFSMVNIYVDSKDSIEKFSEDFINSYEFALKIDSKEKLEALKNNITKLLPYFDSIKQTLKAKDLIVENTNNFNEARIISDIRIVYDDSEIQKKEQLAVVVHNLRITYSDAIGNKEENFYVSLDLSDLNQLKNIINRALEKDELIRTKSNELSFIDVK